MYARHLEYGDLVKVVVNGLRQRQALVERLLDAATALTPGPMAMRGPDWLVSEADHVAGACRDHVRPELGAIDAGNSEGAFAGWAFTTELLSRERPSQIPNLPPRSAKQAAAGS